MHRRDENYIHSLKWYALLIFVFSKNIVRSKDKHTKKKKKIRVRIESTRFQARGWTNAIVNGDAHCDVRSGAHEDDRCLDSDYIK